MSAFEQLHPAIQHHVVNSLGWKRLRPLQEDAIQPILAGEHAILLAPTAGGKTEAAIFPVLSRMLTDDWRGLSVLYVCPIKALLNNLAPRLESYATPLGRRVDVWHGDVGEAAKRKIHADPPDVLLTTPESLEVLLVSKRRDHRRLFAGTRALIVDEIHAFAGDDRGWHLLSVIERVTRIAGNPIQRIGLSATVGNPDELLDWLAGSDDGPRRRVAPTAEATTADDAPEVGLDYVGHIENAARVIASLHRGEKRLVFVDSRARVELLAAHLRKMDVATFVSHSSLSVDDRRQAEQAFAQGSDCVIVATSTLELGIDVGDLDRVIQLDAPSRVASFLQRIGRTGRRPGTTRNCLFLATDEDAFLQSIGLIRLWADGFVEPITPPPLPYHVLAQQILALTLQESGVGSTRLAEWIDGMPGFAALPGDGVEELIRHLLAEQFLFEDQGVLSPGIAAEHTYGGRNFLELFSVFTSPPLFQVVHGRRELGHVHESSFQAKQNSVPVLLLAGRGWVLTHLDWKRRVAFVEPTDEIGKSRWVGAGHALSYDLCQAIKQVLATGHCPARLTRRATDVLDKLAAEFYWAAEDATTIERSPMRVRWWTFAGLHANQALAERLEGFVTEAGLPQNLFIPLNENVRLEDFAATVQAIEIRPGVPFAATPLEAAFEGAKFHECLPISGLRAMLMSRMSAAEAGRKTVGRGVREVEA